MAEGPKKFDSSLGDRTAAFIDAVTGMKKSQGDEISPSWDPMDVLPVERAGRLALGLGKAAARGMAKKALNLPPKFSVFTADNPAAKMLSAEENLARKAQLIKELEERGIPYREAKGQYAETFDRPENSILIPHGNGIDETIVNDLGRKYGQESVVHHVDGKNKLQYVTGDNAGKFNVGEGVNIDPNLENYYTELDGQRFNLGLDFKKLHDSDNTIRVAHELSDLTGVGEELLKREDGTVAAKFYNGNIMEAPPVGNLDPTIPGATTPAQKRLVHYSKYPGEIKELDPAYMGTGSAGKEMQRGVPIQPRTSYYEPGTMPESVVTDPAVNVHYVDAPSPEQIVDLSDPRLKVEGSFNDTTDLENRAKELGFKGFTNKGGALPNAVNLLEKAPVVESMPIDKARLKKGDYYAEGGEVSPAPWQNSFANAVLGAANDPSQEDTAETRAASGLGQTAQYALDSGPMPEMGTPEYASGEAQPDIDVTDLAPNKAMLTGGAKLAGAGALKLAGLLKAKGAVAGLPLAMGAIKKAAQKEAAHPYVDIARKHFGITRDINEAGYILPEGEMLDLSGRHYSQDHPSLKGQRNVDHRELPDEIVSVSKDPEGIPNPGTMRMQHFMQQSGAVRHMPGIGIDVATMPTDAQLRRVIAHHAKLGIPLSVDVSAPDASTIASQVFERPNLAEVKKFLSKNVPAAKGAAEEPQFAQGGQVPQMLADGGMTAPQANTQAPMMPVDPVDAFLANPAPTLSAPTIPEPPGLNEFIAPEMLQEQYGTPGQQALAGVEGVGQGLAGPVFTAAELATGLTTPEAIRRREEANPATSMAGNVAGFVGPAIASGGASALGRMGVAGAAKAAPMLGKIAGATQLGLLESAGAAAASKISNNLAKDFVREAFVGGLYQGGEELNQMLKEDPEQTAGNAIAHIGLATVASGVFGAGVGAAMRGLKGGVAEAPKAAAPFVSQADAPKFEAGDLPTLVKHDAGFTSKEKETLLGGFSKFLKQEKPNAPALRTISKEYGLPLHEGMVSGNNFIQRAEDALLTGASNSIAAVRRSELYDTAYKSAAGILDPATGADSALSRAEVGEIIGNGLTSKIKEEGAVSSRMFNAIKQRTDIIPVDELAIPVIKAELAKIPEYRVSPSSPQGQLGKRILNDLENVKTVDDLKVLKSSIHDSLPATASPGERRMAAILGDSLKKLEEDSIMQHALRTARTPAELAEAQALPAALKAARDTYRPYIQKIEKLAKQLGKSRVHGPQDAINFIDNLDYEQLSSRLFNKNKSEFIGWFAKEFPEEMQVLRQYEKGKLREAGMRQGEFSPLTYFNNYNKLQPEIQAALFSKAEMKKIADMEEYLRSFPKRFNPSGTAAAMNLRNAFQPKALGLINAQDYAIEKFIKYASASPEAANAAALGKATAEGYKLMNKTMDAVLDGSKKLPASIIPLAAHRDKLAKLVLDYQVHPEKMLAANDNNPVPEYQQSFAATTQRAVMYLNSIRPANEQQAPLDPRMPLNDVQKDDYDRALQIAQQPLSILGHMANGTMTPKDVQALQAIYPSVYKQLAEKMIEGIAEKQRKKEEIPYITRMQMSMFLSTPLDSTMKPGAIMGAQMKSGRNQPETPTMPASGAKHSMKGLDKMAKSYQTQVQARESARSGK